MNDNTSAAGERPRDSLRSLLELPGVLAGMIATEEGLPLAARLRSALDEDALAAAAAVLGQLGTKALDGMGNGNLGLVVLDASKFRFMVQPLAAGYLMLVTEPDAEPEPVAAEMTAAVVELDRAIAELEAGHAA
jgi:predicted regulator of Ras-like GTPase activity (Roadblock/LC7/MglB family)